MAGGLSDRTLRDVYRLFHVGAVGTMSDAQLLERFVSRRDEAAEAAFEELVIRHGPMVRQVCRGILRDEHDAEDALQAVFLVLASRAGTIRRGGSIASWLFGVSRRVAARARRGAARRRALDRRAAERLSESYLPTEYDPDRGIIHEEIDDLPARLRAAVVLCYLQGLTYAAAARQLGISEMAVRGRLARARDRLRRRLARRGVTVPAGLLVAGAAGRAPVVFPMTLIHSTSSIAMGSVAGRSAAVLARGVLNSMLLHRIRLATILIGLGLGGGLLAWQALVAADVGKGQANPGPKVPTVQLIHPTVRDIVRVVGQPASIEAYERTSIFPKVTAYINKWFVDIGDRVKKGDQLATLFAPEMVEDHNLKRATVGLDKERVGVANEGVGMAQGELKAAEARLREAKAILDKYEAEVHRWDSEVQRLRKEVDRGVVDPAVLAESRDHLKASRAARDATKAAIEKAEADRVARQHALSKARLDVRVAAADLRVAESDEMRARALVGYLTLSAPFDGVIVARNANTFDLVQPAQGATPVYVVDRTDIVRVFVDVPEQDAGFIHAGGKAAVQVRAYRGEPIEATVTRTSWALNTRSRSLRVEIDLPNPDGRILPGMYAYARVFLERDGARALPTAAVASSGDRAYCWTYKDGRAVRTPIETGLSDGRWVEVLHRLAPEGEAAAAGKETRAPLDESEPVILGDLSTLRDGAPVRVAPETSHPR